MSGFDAPVRSKDEDHLDRWPFAQQIARLAIDTPRDWSVRIAVYGGWGEGKTSVLRFVESIATERGHVVAWFNPWGCTGSADLWLTFVQAIGNAFKERPEPELAAVGKQLRSGKNVEKVCEYLKRNEALITAGAAVGAAAAGLPILTALVPAVGKTALPPLMLRLARKRQSVVEVISGLPAKRLVVLIDDLDRINPALLPQLLYALREVLDQPGFSFVLAIDPDRVGEVLKGISPGWKDGAAYLDKIIDFPRHLPAPSACCCRRLALAEMKERCPFVDEAAMVSVLDLLPRNPRVIRQFVRQMWSLSAAAARHDPGELIWEAVLLAELIRLSWPGLAAALLADRDVLQGLLLKHAQHQEISAVFDKAEKAKEAGPTALVQAALDLTELSKQERERAVSATTRLGDLIRSFLPPERVAASAFLSLQPPAVTAREWHHFVATTSNTEAGPAASNRWIHIHAERAEAAPQQVHAELFEHALVEYEDCLEQAAGEPLDDRLREHARRARAALEAVRLLGLDLAGFCGTSPRLRPAHLASLLVIVRDRSNWRNHSVYVELRDAEGALVHDVVATSTLDPVDTLATLTENVARGFHDADHPHFQTIYEEVVRTFLERLADQVLGEFDRGDFRLTSGEGAPTQAKRNLVLDPTGPLWSGERRQRFLALAVRGVDDAAVGALMLHLLRFLASHAARDTESIQRAAQARQLLSDKELVDAIWSAAVSRPLNPRVIGTLSDTTLPTVEDIVGSALPKPGWWATPASPQQPGVDGSQD